MPIHVSNPLRLFFKYLYHQLAWSYDLIAYVVSLGQWARWVFTSIGYLDQQPVLELGFGTGQLQRVLLEKNFAIYGIDESRQMVEYTQKKLGKAGVQPNIARAVSQRLPFRANFFGAVVSTFPAEYIFSAETISEMKRVLIPGGKAVICPVAWITGKSIQQKMAARLFRITNESPPLHELLSGPVNEYLEQLAGYGFEASCDLVQLEASQVLVILARKSEDARIR